MKNNKRIFYTSDLHLGHENVIKFCNRPFKNADEMDKVIIDNWNSIVTAEDIVYILGDMIYASKKDPKWYLNQLKGQKRLIIGNHEGYLKKLDNPYNYFESIEQYADIKDGINRCILFHYPIASWNGMHRGVYHIHGHMHNNGYYLVDRKKCNIIIEHERVLNATVDINGFKPVTLQELIENNRQKDYKYSNF